MVYLSSNKIVLRYLSDAPITGVSLINRFTEVVYTIDLVDTLYDPIGVLTINLQTAGITLKPGYYDIIINNNLAELLYVEE